MTKQLHVMPLQDLREHEESDKCWCSPEIDPEWPMIVVHNSADRREKFETGERKAS
jgi:hypothetical protein